MKKMTGLFLLAWSFTANLGATAFGQAAAGAPLGSPAFQPSAARPVGWRGDWTGRYPGATPPADWKIEKDGSGAKVLWHTQLPLFLGGSGASQPIVVGDKIFFCVGPKDANKGPEDLYCLSLVDGKILWIRPLTAHDAAPEADRAQVKAVVDPLVTNLQVQTLKLIEELNAGKINQDNWRGDVRAARCDLGSRITVAYEGVDKDRYKMGDRHDWGYASATPCSDGKFVYVWYANRLGGCFDLNGKLIWATMEPRKVRGTGEHGSHGSPILLPDRVVCVYGTLVQAFDKKTGQVLWQKEAQDAWGLASSSLVPFNAKDGFLVIMAHAQAFRADTGESLWGKMEGYQGENTTPVIDGHTLITYERSGIRTFQLPDAIAGGKIEPADAYRYPNPFVDYQVASPLFHDGLVYCVNEIGILRVFDPQCKSTLVYEQKLDLKGEHGWVGAPGISPSPCLAGKNLYVMDNHGTMVVVEPGRTFKQVAKCENATGDVFVVSPVFHGKKIILRGQTGIYCVGEK